MQRETTQAAIAAAAGISAPKMSRMLSDHLDDWTLILAHAGLKVVPVETKCFQEDQINALLVQAKAYMARVDTPASLVWDEDE